MCVYCRGGGVYIDDVIWMSVLARPIGIEKPLPGVEKPSIFYLKWSMFLVHPQARTRSHWHKHQHTWLYIRDSGGGWVSSSAKESLLLRYLSFSELYYFSKGKAGLSLSPDISAGVYFFPFILFLFFCSFSFSPWNLDESISLSFLFLHLRVKKEKEIHCSNGSLKMSGFIMRQSTFFFCSIY